MIILVVRTKEPVFLNSNESEGTSVDKTNVPKPTAIGTKGSWLINHPANYINTHLYLLSLVKPSNVRENLQFLSNISVEHGS